ncbi:MAG: DUF2232 domain-containing protein [Mariprofundales bacterium]
MTAPAPNSSDTDNIIHIMPAWLDRILTNRLPCATLAMFLFASMLPFSTVSQNASGFTLLLLILAMVIHGFTPALFATIVHGGGWYYSSQVAIIAAFGIYLLTGFQWIPALVLLFVYGLVIIVASLGLYQQQGLERSLLALAAFSVILTSIGLLIVSAVLQEASVSSLIETWITPLFEQIRQQSPPTGMTDVQFTQAMTQMHQSLISIFPAVLALSLWLFWAANVLLGRVIAMRFGFYNGDNKLIRKVYFDKRVAYAFLVSLLAIAFAPHDSIALIASSACLLLVILLGLQGLAVAHTKLLARKMPLLMVMLYLMVILQPITIVPFVVFGLLDIWFDFRQLHLVK